MTTSRPPAIVAVRPGTTTRFLRRAACVVALGAWAYAGLNGPVQAAGTIALMAFGAAYTQSFEGLAAAGTSSVVPTGWDFAEAGTNANTAYTAGTGSGNAGDTYSFGMAGSSDRALGGLLSGTLTPTIGAQFTNQTGGTITELAIAFTGEMWRAGVADRGAADRLDFQLSLDATSLTTGLWTDYDALDFSSPNITTTVGAKDGNLAINRTAVSAVLTGLSIPAGATFWIRWTDFNIGGSDDGLAIDDFSLTPAGVDTDSPPAVSSSVPANGATGVPAAAALVVTFTEPVTVTGDWFRVSCAASGLRTPANATVTGGPTQFTIAPLTPFAAAESCSLTVVAGLVSDVDATDPPDVMAADHVSVFTVEGNACILPFTPVHEIQGSGASAAITGAVSTQGVVVGDYEYPGAGATASHLRGFYLQDPVGDGDPATSDAIFVFNGNNDSVQLGDIVRVSGTAGEFQDQTQISSVTALTRCGSGTVTPVDVSFPVPSSTFLERFEGMLVRVPQTMYVTEHFQLGRFGQVVLSSDDRLMQPTNVVVPGVPAAALQASNALRRLIVDDATQDQNPDPIVFGRNGQPLSAANTLRGGDEAAGLVGVLTYTWAGNSASGNAFRLRPGGALGGHAEFQAANPRPDAAPAVGGTLKVAAMNVLNFFNTFGASCRGGVGGEIMECRGAEDATEFARQRAKTAAAILAVNADVLGVNELENDGYGPDSALRDLVDLLNAATAPGTYAFIDVDARTGQLNAMGNDAIRTALLYKPAAVTPVGRTAALNSVAFVNGGDSGPRNRASVVQAFRAAASGGVFLMNLNHLKSKGSACDAADAGDGQGNCNVVRVNAVGELLSWLQTDPTATGDADVLLLGDYNSYAKEDPIRRLLDGGFTDLVDLFVGTGAYSYVFDGQWGSLDHALASASLVTQVTGVGEFHVNADEPSVLDYNLDFKSAGQAASLYSPDAFRMADHDPVIVGLALRSDVVRCDADMDGDIDATDLELVRAALGQPAATTFDPRDGNADGAINIADLRFCTLRVSR